MTSNHLSIKYFIIFATDGPVFFQQDELRTYITR